MRVALSLALFVAVAFAGCVTTLDDGPKVFDRTCPVYHASPGSPAWRNTALVYDTTSAEPSLHENPQVDKWIVRPTVGGGFDYRNGTLDFVELNLKVDYIINATIAFTAYVSAPGEPAAFDENQMTEEEHMAHTGPQLMIRDMNKPGNPLVGEVTFGPAGGTQDTIILDVGGIYRVEFTDGTGGFDPSNLRMDVTFTVDESKDHQNAAAAFEMKASLWYRHHDCA